MSDGVHGAVYVGKQITEHSVTIAILFTFFNPEAYNIGFKPGFHFATDASNN